MPISSTWLLLINGTFVSLLESRVKLCAFVLSSDFSLLFIFQILLFVSLLVLRISLPLQRPIRIAGAVYIVAVYSGESFWRALKKNSRVPWNSTKHTFDEDALKISSLEDFWGAKGDRRWQLFCGSHSQFRSLNRQSKIMKTFPGGKLKWSIKFIAIN